MIGAAVSLGGLVQAQTTHHVSQDGLCEGKTPCYTSIQAAINVANTGDIVNVMPGTYNEELVFNNGIVLEGSGLDAATSEAGIPGKSSFVIQDAINVTVRGIKVNNSKNSGANAPKASPFN
jgi:pectin methylesterase-like acyl-CoA thioesterase